MGEHMDTKIEDKLDEQKLYENVDVIIAGTGVAGLFCALHIPKDKKILMITKDKLENSDSFLAQGGISTLKNSSDYASYFEDTMRAGHYENNRESVKVMIESSSLIMKELIEAGVEFDRVNGELSYTREGAHSVYRILHHKDITGKEITSKLIAKVKELDNATILENTMMIDIIENNNVCQGIVLQDSTGIHSVYSKKIVWATGGLGGLFESTTNFSHLTGDSIAIALKHQIALQDLNYIQIHPTTLYSKKKGRRFLISESVRGEGAILLNQNKERFVDELLPRDVVTIAIHDQMAKSNKDYVYLSMKHLEKEVIMNHFPNIYERCLEEGYDITKDMIPVAPAQHYFMGGVKIDQWGQTSMERLYAIGETSCNGVHGANRLASNSLLESLVFAKRAAHKISKTLETVNQQEIHTEISAEEYKNLAALQKEYKELVWNEIKRKDVNFYAKWCNNANQCG